MICLVYITIFPAHPFIFHKNVMATLTNHMTHMVANHRTTNVSESISVSDGRYGTFTLGTFKDSYTIRMWQYFLLLGGFQIARCHLILFGMGRLICRFG